MSLLRLSALAAATLCLALAVADHAGAQSYPTQPIKIIVAAAPGGPSDFPARLASQILPPQLGQPVVVENRGGAGGAIGAREVAEAPPDGYTLLIGNTSTLAVIPAVSTSAGYDPVKDFMPIAKVTEGFQILVVHPSSPFKSIKELVDHAKANPGKLNYAHTGAGGLPHLAGELFMWRSGAKMTGVSYRSGGESNTAVLSQAVDLTLENIAILGALIRDGKLRALAVANKHAHAAPAGGADHGRGRRGRTPRPTPSSAWWRRPARPRASSCKLNAAMNEGMQAADVQARLAKARHRGEARLARGVRRLHRRPAPQVDGRRQGRRREDRLSGVRTCRRPSPDRRRRAGRACARSRARLARHRLHADRAGRRRDRHAEDERGEYPHHGVLPALGDRRRRARLPVPAGLSARHRVRDEPRRLRARPHAAAAAHEPATGTAQPDATTDLLADVVRPDPAALRTLVSARPPALPDTARIIRASKDGVSADLVDVDERPTRAHRGRVSGGVRRRQQHGAPFLGIGLDGKTLGHPVHLYFRAPRLLELRQARRPPSSSPSIVTASGRTCASSTPSTRCGA